MWPGPDCLTGLILAIKFGVVDLELFKWVFSIMDETEVSEVDVLAKLFMYLSQMKS